MSTASTRAVPPAAPTFEVEDELRAGGARIVAGMDEVGRGAWAGPLLVCAAVPGEGAPPAGLTDSKRLTPKRRRELAERLAPWVADHAFGWSEPAEIDEVGMTEALHRAARRALEGLSARPDAVILDGRHDFIGRPWRVRTQVKGDLTCVSVAAAAILAKVRRDAFMAELDADHPGYGFDGAAGYPSPVHRATLAESGPTPHHRLSWSYLDALPRWRHLRTYREGTAPTAGSAPGARGGGPEDQGEQLSLL
ncbi:ribonuclease HII [Nocardiopsis sp. EMB25]|uniref:ribonuclease HII n=1 Tax=Nocardiopsis sp. EMB25 TaxID=2835867 RepID=UPI0022852820|nr:ribonuclease HII [Nocardiopsis sp. EMB25]MCY9785013.1 ribonuclease HII [Nocardiopsis sp. EMB25]